MKVLFVYQFATLGGVESVLRSRLEGLPAFGVDAHVWFLADSGGLGTFDGFRDRVHVGGPQPLMAFVADLDPDVIASIDTEEVLRLPFEVKSALIAECHSPYFENLGYLSRLDGQLVRVVLVPSAHQRETVERKIRHAIPVRVVPNPVGEAFLCENIQLREIPSRPILAWIGRLDALKDWEAFLEIGSLVCSTHEAQLWVVGDTSEPSAARRLYRVAKEKRVLSSLSWLRAVPYSDMPSVLATVKASGGLVVSTSRNESFGMGVAEAMACSNVVIAPRIGPFEELISDGVTGFLYDRKSPAAAAQIAGALLADSSLRSRSGGAARQGVMGRYSPTSALPVLVDELRVALTGHRSY